MKPIFIDANSLLLFYKSKETNLTIALNNLLKVEKEVFITDQIVYEVRRNNYNLFHALINDITNRNKINAVNIPQHFVSDKFTTNWKKEENAAVTSINNSLDKVRNELFKELEKVYASTDSVSVKLQKIFKHAAKETENELGAARLRKERGNPPGKRSDPLGDQLSWTQFLNQIDTSKNEVWIITSDTDYFYKIDKKLVLHPFLYDELKRKNNRIIVNCFDRIIDGLTSYNDSHPIKKFPKKSSITKIKTAEDAARHTPYHFTFSGDAINNIISSRIFAKISWCSTCKEVTEDEPGPVIENAITFPTCAVCKSVKVPQVNIFNSLFS